MDITYKPYLRDNIEINYPLSNSADITSSYRPKYTVVKEEIEEEPVESEIKIEEPKPIFNAPKIKSSSRPSKSFSSKEEFSKTMTPIYEKLLKQKGLNPAFAKALVAQDGLESAWGQKPSGSFNYGGIKGKGTVKNTREVINGKDIRLNQEFRDFSSLEDYANFKINLLNNNRYRAFSGSVNDFASRVARGGYATDPKYQSVLQRMIQKSKLGGVLRKFQEGGRIKDRWTDREDIEATQEWMTNWYDKRRHIINKNLWDRSSLPKWLQSKTLGYHWLNDRLTSVDTYLYNSGPEEQEEYKKAVNGLINRLAKIDISDQYMANREGVYNADKHYLVVKADSKIPVNQIAAHELAHSTNPYFIIDTIKEYEKYRPIHTMHVSPDEYLDNPAEIYSRLMQFRKQHNIDPTHVFTKKEIEELRDKQTQKIQYGYTFKNRNTGEEIVKIVDKIDFSMYPGSTRDWHLEDGTMFRYYKPEGDPDLFNRYNDNFLLFLLNDVAKAPIEQNDKIKSAKFGGIIPKFQDSGKFIPSILPPKQKSFDRANKNWQTPKTYSNLDLDIVQQQIGSFEGVHRNLSWYKDPNYAENGLMLIGHGVSDKLLKEKAPDIYERSLKNELSLDDIKFIDKLAVDSEWQVVKDTAAKYNVDVNKLPENFQSALLHLKYMGVKIGGTLNLLSEYSNYRDPNLVNRWITEQTVFNKDTLRGNWLRYGYIRGLIDGTMPYEQPINKDLPEFQEKWMNYRRP